MSDNNPGVLQPASSHPGPPVLGRVGRADRRSHSYPPAAAAAAAAHPALVSLPQAPSSMSGSVPGECRLLAGPAAWAAQLLLAALAVASLAYKR